MAITSQALTQAILARRGILAGASLPAVASAVGTAFVAWGVGQPARLRLSGTVTGLAGPGTIPPATTRLVVPDNPSILLSCMVGAGIGGDLARPLAEAVSGGVSQAVTAWGQYAGTSPAACQGVDASVVSWADGAALAGLLASFLPAALGSLGPLSMPLASGLGHGIATMLMGATGTGSVLGVPIVPSAPMVGVSDSMLV